MSEWTLLAPAPWWRRGRLYLAYRVLRGRPLIYRVHLLGPLVFKGGTHVLIRDCNIETPKVHREKFTSMTMTDDFFEAGP